jgi:hypothetical protein
VIDEMGNSTSFKPSDVARWFATHVIKWSEWLGMQWARLSSFMDFIKLENVYVAITNLSNPIFEIIGAPYFFMRGYCTMANLYDHPYLTVIGSIVLITVCVFVSRKFLLSRGYLAVREQDECEYVHEHEKSASYYEEKSTTTMKSKKIK